MPIEIHLEKLFFENHKSFSITKIVDKIFDNLNSQEDYCKALININLFNIVSEFYKKRMNDFLLNSDNVHYYLNEEEK